MSIQKKPLSVRKVCLLLVGVAFILLGRFLPEFFVTTLFINSAIDGSAFVSAMSSLFWVSWVVRGFGIFLLCYVGFTTQFHVDRVTFKHQLKRQFAKTSTLAIITLSLLACSAFVETPLVNADYTNTIAQGFKITMGTGLGYDWIIGKLTSGLFFAVNGNTGNSMTFVEPWQNPAPWAAYASDSSALTGQVFASITFGTVYMKEVAFDYSNLAVPANVQVIENVNGLTRTFVSSGNSQGSPYTVSVGAGDDEGYYFCQDSAGRFLDDWSSTNASSVIINATTAGDSVAFSSGTYTLTSTVLCYNLANKTIYSNGGAVLSMADTILKPIMNWTRCDNFTMYGLTFDHNLPADGTGVKKVGTHALQAINCTYLDIHDCTFMRTADFAVSLGTDQFDRNPTPIGAGYDPEIPQTAIIRPVNYVNFHSNKILFTRADGLDIVGAHYRITNNLFNVSDDDQLAIQGGGDSDGSLSPCYDIIVSHNDFVAPRSYAIRVGTSLWRTSYNDEMNCILVTENTIDCSPSSWVGNGICVQNAFGNNVVDYSGGMYFATNVTISKNIIRHTAGSAIVVANRLVATTMQWYFGKSGYPRDLTISENDISMCGYAGYPPMSIANTTQSKIIDNTISYAHSTESTVDLMLLWQVTNSTISGNTLTDSMRCGINDTSGANNAIFGNHITATTKAAIAVTSGVVENVYENIISQCGFTTYHAILLQSCSESHADRNTISYSAVSGYASITNFLGTYNTMSGNHIFRSGGMGIQDIDSIRTIIDGNDIIESAKQGLIINYVGNSFPTNITARNNYVANSGYGGSSHDYDNYYLRCTFSYFSGNVAFWSGATGGNRYGIYIHSDCKSVTVFGGNVLGGGQDGVMGGTLSGSGIVVSCVNGYNVLPTDTP